MNPQKQQELEAWSQALNVILSMYKAFVNYNFNCKKY